MFRQPSIQALLTAELYKTQRDQIEADKMAAAWGSQAKMLRERTQQLQQQINEQSRGQP